MPKSVEGTRLANPWLKAQTSDGLWQGKTIIIYKNKSTIQCTDNVIIFYVR